MTNYAMDMFSVACKVIIDFASEKGCTALDASMCDFGAHLDTRSVRSVFCDAHVVAENLLNFFFRCGEKTLRGFVYIPLISMTI